MRHFLLLPILALAACGNADGALGPDAGDPCQQLVARTCGDLDAGSACQASASCNSARLTSTYEHDRCAALLQDPQYQECNPDRAATGGNLGSPSQDWPSDCDTLLDKVCGTGDPRRCHGSDACAGATDVSAAGNNAACRQAIGDDTAFPRCQVP